MTALLVALFCAGLLLPAGQASARKVGNPGSFHAEVTNGTIRIKDNTFNFDDSDPNNKITFDGSIDSQGNVNIPENGVHFPNQSVSGYTVRIIPSDPITGTLNPLTGNTSLRLRVWIKIDGIPFGGDCRIGSDSSPIDVNTLITGTTNPPGPNTPITGIPYNPSNGTVRIVNNSYSVPASSDCGPAGGTVNSELGIPSSAGNNEARFTLAFRTPQGTPTPITKGVNASFTTTPSTGEIPLPVNFDGSASTRVCSPNACQFRWDFDGNGTTDQTTSGPTTSHTYQSSGTFQPRLTVVDTDGDSDSTTRTVTPLPHPPNLAITKSHAGDFLANTVGTYTLAVSNVGAGATQGTVTVTDNIPAALGTYAGASGTGWTCNAAGGQTMTCTRSSVAAGTAAPNITLNVNVAAGAPAAVSNTASVSSTSNPPDPNTANNTSTDPTTVKRIDLLLDKSHEADFKTGSVETYHLDVSNQGTAATTHTATVTDTLPGGLTYQGASAPVGWTCNQPPAQTVTCTHAAGFQPSESDRIDIQVVAGATIVGTPPNGGVTNVASVTTQSDANSANDSDSDPTTVIATVDLTIDKAHTTAFRVGSAAAYTIAVQNRGARATNGTTTVTDTLPAGLVPGNASGIGWICDTTGQTVTCTNGVSLGANDSAGLITVPVTVDPSALAASQTSGTKVNTASVVTAGTGNDADSNPANNSDSDSTAITATDLVMDKSHVGGFPVGGQASYTLSVRNDGSAPTVGTTTVTDSLPAELSFVNATGSGWDCGAVGQDVTCTRTSAIDAGQTAPAITLVVDVADTEEEEVVNTASVSTADDVIPGNNSDSDPTPITAADLALTKTHSGDFRAAQTRAYTIRVSNVGSQSATGTTTVTDTLPAGLSYVSGTGSGWSCGAAGQLVTCTRTAPIASAANAPPITLQVSVAESAYPGVINTAVVSNDDDRNDANDTAQDPTTVTAPDLSIDKTHVGSVQVNDRMTYAINVENDGTADTTATTTVTDELPTGLTYAGFSGGDWSCSATPQQVVTCEHDGSIDAGEAAQTLELRADVAAAVSNELVNTAVVAVDDDPNAANDSDQDSAPVGRIDVGVQKSHVGELPRGGTATYTIAVSNSGSDSTKGVTRVTDVLPAGLDYASAGGPGWSCSYSAGTVECLHAGSIGGGASAQPITLQADVDRDAAASIDNTATVTTPGDASATNDSSTDQGTVSAGRDASVTIRPALPAGGAFRVGTNGTYVVTVRNNGSSDLTDPVTATVTLPSGLSLASSDSPDFDCTPSGQEVECTDDDGMDRESRSDIALEVAVSRDATPSVTTAAEVTTPGDAVAANDTDQKTTDVTMIDLSVAMIHTGTFGVGEQGAFVINLENVGTARTINAARIVDELPAGLTVIGASGAGWSCNVSDQVVGCTRDEAMDPGDQAEPLTIAVTPQASVGSATLTNRVNAFTKQDGDSANNTATDQVTIGAAPAAPQQQVKGKTKTCKKKGKKGKKGKKKCKKGKK